VFPPEAILIVGYLAILEYLSSIRYVYYITHHTISWSETNTSAVSTPPSDIAIIFKEAVLLQFSPLNVVLNL
jgi:hypothetical protein